MRRFELWVACVAALSMAVSACGDDDTNGGAGAEGPGGTGGAGGSGGSWQPGAEIVSVTVESTAGADAQDVPVTFGQIFAPGDVPAGTFVGVTSGGEPLATVQLDDKATHPDGSLRHGIISLVLPSLAAGGSADLTIVTADGALGGDPLSLDALLAGSFDAVVTATLGSTAYHASARDALESGSPTAWIAGPAATEWLVSTPLVDDASAAHPHLTARFAVRAHANSPAVRVDVTVENTWTYAPSPQNYTYDLEVTVGGQSVYSRSAVEHYRQSRWRKIFWTESAPAWHLRHDARYLIDSGAVPSYDLDRVVPEDALAAMEGEWTGDAIEPMGAGLVEPYMPMTGGRRDIGPLPRWAARYLISMDPRAARATYGTADLAGSWPIHYRDQDTGLPVTLADYPYMTLLGNPGDTVNPDTGQSEAFPDCAGECSTPYSPDSAHQPSLAYLPYLLTGDHYYLEELQFWANWNMLESNPHYREFEQGLLDWGQVRGQAWSLRTLAEAAYATPDDHPLKAYFVDRVGYNLDWYLAEYPDNASANALGILANGYAFAYTDGRGVAPWQDDFFTWATGHVVELGFTEAAPLRDYKSRFVIGRLTDPDFCWVFASMYSMIVRASSSDPVYATFAEAYEQSLRDNYSAEADALLAASCGGADMATELGLSEGEMVGYSSSATGYPSNMQIAAAIAADSDAAGGTDAWAVFDARAVKPDYGPDPQFALVPREP